MSEITVEKQGGLLLVRQQRLRQTPQDLLEIDTAKLCKAKMITSEMRVKSRQSANRILYCEPCQAEADAAGAPLEEGKFYIMVWSNQTFVKYGLVKKAKVYEELIKLRYKVYRVGLTRKHLTLWMTSFLNPLGPDVKVSEVRLALNPANYVDANMLVTTKKISGKQKLKGNYIHHYKLPLSGLYQDETRITNTMKYIVTVNGEPVVFYLEMKDEKIGSAKQYFVPIKTKFTDGHAVHIRRNTKGELAIVTRKTEPEEQRLAFKIKESTPVSFLLYHLGRYVMRHSGKKVNLFYEKFAAHAEEGTFELFKRAQKSDRSRSYYIIDAKAPDYQRIKGEKGVVTKFSWKYYWLMYRVNAFIATEAPAHLHILRSNNKYIRRVSYERKFIFLQHGVTYLKKQGASSAFLAGKEGEPAFMVVGSEKERDVCVDMLRLPEERFINAGLPIFDTIPYRSIDEKSEDIVLIMLTWKRDDEMHEKFEMTDYYRNVMALFEEVSAYLGREKILVIPHPKVLERCEGTPLSDIVWKGSVADALARGKLLLTDYSSACYNSFYQGAGVIFYQPDLAAYEKMNGKMIPEDDEYIGMRVFDPEALRRVLDKVLAGGAVDLSACRNAEYERRYDTINEFHDGNNVERIFRALAEKKIV